MQPNHEVDVVSGDCSEVQASSWDGQLSGALRLPPALRHELIERLRKADRPVLATPVVP
jgi:hypothetical protein